MRARAHRDRETENKVPPDALRELLTESLRLAEDDAAARDSLEPKRSHTLNVQKATVAKAKPSTKACHLTGDHLLRERKRAGMVA